MNKRKRKRKEKVTAKIIKKRKNSGLTQSPSCAKVGLAEDGEA